MTINEKVAALLALFEKESIERRIADGVGCQVNLDKCKTHSHDAKKYIRIDIGDSGAYMIDKATEEIFSIKGYGVIHRGHQYGTLDTIAEWNWGGYRAVKKKVLAPA